MSPCPRKAKAPEVALHVLAYFLRNPHAADTLEGIARWRLLEEDVRRTVHEADDAITWLVDHGLLRQEPDRQASPLFRLNEVNIAEAERLLRRQTSRKAKKQGRRGG